MKYSFIKISNNKNSNVDFIIDITTMSSYSLRVSALLSQCKRQQLGQHKYPDRDVYRILRGDWSFCLLEKGDYPNILAAKNRCDWLYDREYIKMNWTECYGDSPNLILLGRENEVAELKD